MYDCTMLVNQYELSHNFLTWSYIMFSDNALQYKSEFEHIKYSTYCDASC